MLNAFDNEIEELTSAWGLTLEDLLQSYEGVAVACSAGLDSTVLLHLLLAFTRQKKKFPLAICHVNFGLRPKDSAADEAFLAALAAEHKLPFFGYRPPPPPSKAGIQAWARKERYGHFAALAKKGWVVAMAHHLDDVAENALLRLARGVSPAGLAGMQGWNPPYWRPLLNLRKQDLQAWASRHNLPHRHDVSNDKMDYSRNVIRHKVLPELEALFPGAASRIARCAWQAGEYAALVRGQTPAQPSSLSLAALQAMAPPLRWEAITSLIGPLPEGRRRLTHKFLSQVMLHLEQPPTTSWSLALPGGHRRLQARAGVLRVQAETGRGHPRTQQHRRTWWPVDERMALEAGASVTSYSPGGRPKAESDAGARALQKTLTIAISSRPGRQIRVYLPKASAHVRFAGYKRRWAFKELQARNQAQAVPAWGVNDADPGEPCLVVASADYEQVLSDDLRADGLLGAQHKLLACDDTGLLQPANVTVQLAKFHYDD